MPLAALLKRGRQIPRWIIKHVLWLFTIIPTRTRRVTCPIGPIGIVVATGLWFRPSTGIVIPFVELLAAFFSCVEEEVLVIGQHVVGLLACLSYKYEKIYM
jgi:hypothetical protein